MRAVIVAPIRLLGDGLARSLDGQCDVEIVRVVSNVAETRALLAATRVHAVLIDMTQPIDLDEVRSLAMAGPDVVLIAIGLKEQRQDVIRCGRAGFTGYVSRDATIEGLTKAMHDAVAGRLACPDEISGGLLRALFRREVEERQDGEPLTKREGDVLQLIGRGLTNKEIARELGLSVATVKHHVHNVLEKLSLPRRAHAMRRVRERPWLVG
ncbi:LuxR C-terminal-related transcriptional regulator [Bradyrhizobium diazoefficiens]|uniref:LuxR C-terminal-related transcriptional regulator n=1 Tax=Bradyrhizobium diazoefficiens TaxID=1355477 RepID=UPI000577F81B|nr:response regulator transcription factor [Bradyrhizobium diazoefficiens]QDF37500.1 response regulator transcription factor [Bradyrhizobium symbiodeficiens]